MTGLAREVLEMVGGGVIPAAEGGPPLDLRGIELRLEGSPWVEAGRAMRVDGRALNRGGLVFFVAQEDLAEWDAAGIGHGMVAVALLAISEREKRVGRES